MTKGNSQEVPYSFSRDGKRLAFHQPGNGGSPDIFTAPIEGDPGHPLLGKADPFRETPSIEMFPAFSPDGRWVAYQSDVSGIFEVYVRPFPLRDAQWQISTGGGLYPVWSRDQRHDLLFQTLDLQVMAVSYTAKGNEFARGNPWVWTKTRLRNTGPDPKFDLAPDGKRLAALVADDESGEKPPTQLTFLLNFFDELQRRAPVTK